MATSTDDMSYAGGNTLLAARALFTGAIAAVIFFAACWLGTFIPSPALPHAYVRLFTNADVSSIQALAQAAFWSLLAGAFAGAVIALVYKGSAFLDRR